jgi:hypothetical protein
VFCEGVQHRLPFCLDYLSYVKMVAFQFQLQSEKQKSMVSRGRQLYCFWSKIPWWKKKCETVRCRDAIAYVRGEVFAQFHVVTKKCHSSIRKLLFVLPGRVLY